MFEKAQTNIKVKLVNAGQGETEYAKLRTAIKAGSEAPDVVHIEFQFIPTFRQIDALADLSELARTTARDDFAAWTWEQVSEGDAVYAMPWDSGPMALLYRKDIFDQYGHRGPDDLGPVRAAGRQAPQADPETYLADFTPDGWGWLTGLMWQAGARPFEVDGTKLSINMDDPAIQKVSDYWGDLVDRGVVEHQARLHQRLVQVVRQGHLRDLAHRRLGSCVPRRIRRGVQGQVAGRAASAVGGR